MVVTSCLETPRKTFLSSFYIFYNPKSCLKMPYTLLLLGILHLLSWVLLFLHMGTSLVMLDNNVFNMDIMTWCKWRIQFKIWLFWLLPRCSLKEIKLYSFNHIELQTFPKRDSFIMSLLNFCIQWPLKTYLISIGLLYGISDFKMFTNGKTTRNFLRTKKYVSKSYHAFYG